MTTDDLIGSLVAQLRPVRPLPGAGSRALRWGAAAAACVTLGVCALGPRSDLSEQWRDPRYLRETACLALVFVLAAWSAFDLSVPRLARDRRGRLAACACVFVWFTITASRATAEDLIANAAFWSSGLACVHRTAWLALAPSCGVLWMLRRAAPLERGWAGAFAALSAASLAMIGTQAICANDEPWHVLLWHAAPVLIAALAGSALGTSLFGRSAAAVRR